MFATLTNGEYVELQKDCSCAMHDGQHWLYENDLANYLYLDSLSHNPQDAMLWLWFCERQIERLCERQQWLERCNIQALHYTPHQKHWLEVQFNEKQDAALIDTRTNTIVAIYRSNPNDNS